jgi:hypothetical protein
MDTDKHGWETSAVKEARAFAHFNAAIPKLGKAT